MTDQTKKLPSAELTLKDFEDFVQSIADKNKHVWPKYMWYDGYDYKFSEDGKCFVATSKDEWQECPIPFKDVHVIAVDASKEDFDAHMKQSFTEMMVFGQTVSKVVKP